MTGGLISPPVWFLKMTPPFGCLSEGTVAAVNQSINVPSVFDQVFLVHLQEDIDMLSQWEEEESGSVEQEETDVLDPLFEGSKISKD